MVRKLIVCSITNWIAQDFVDGLASTDWEVVPDRGLYLPEYDHSDDTTWWMPTEHAVKLAHSGFEIPFIAPGPQWLSTISESLTRRKILTQPYSEIMSLDTDMKIWVKPAEFKHQSFFAGLYSVKDLEDFNLPEESLLQWTETVLNISEEYRFFIHNKQVVGGSVYLVDGMTYYDGAVGSKNDDACKFAQNAVDEIGSNQPPAYVLDVAFDVEHKEFLVLEANPAFSSAIYGVEPAAIMDALHTCSHPGATDSKWLWNPDTYLVKKFSRMVPLQSHPAKLGK